MSRLSRLLPTRFWSRRVEKRRRSVQKRKARHHIVQTLERRDHPGSMLEVSMVALLGRPEGESQDPIDEMLRSAEGLRARQEQYQRLTNFRSQSSSTFRRVPPKPFDDFRAPPI